MKLFFGRYTYSAFLIPFLTLALVYFSANQAIQQVLDIRRLSLEAVSDWYLLYHLTGKRFQFLDDDTAKNSHTWLQALNDFELVMQNLAETPLQWLLDDQTRQDIQASYKVWDFTRQNILDSDQVYCQMVASPIGQALLQADLAQLAEAALTGVAPGSFTPGDLWQFYQLQDRLAELEVSSSIFTSYLERIEQAVERRVLLLNLVISAIALLISGVVIASTWRLFAITSAERERYVAEIEARNHALAHEVADRRLAEENLRLTLHSIGDGVIVTDQQGRVTRMNPVAEQLCGWPLAEAQGHCLSDVFQIVNAETRQAAENPVQRVLQEGVVVGLANHTMLIARDGRERQIADSAAPIFSVSGDLAGVVMVFRDVTEAYAMQREMEDRQAKLSSIFRVAPVGIGVVINRIFSEVNDTLCAMIGYRRDELVGQSARMIYPTQEDYEYVGQVKYDQIRHRGTGIVETRWQHKDGRILHILLSSTPINPQDWSQGVTFTALDITERKEAEQELQTLNQRLERELRFNEALLRAIPTPVFFKDAQGRYLGCNQAFAEVMGVSGEGMIGKTVFDLWPPELAQVYHQADLDLLADPRHQLYEARVVRRDGQTREVFFAKDVFYDENGQVAGIVGAYMDITEQKQAIASLRASQEAERLFSARLTRLVTAITDLSATPDFDTLCRRAIEQGISQLGFERLGLWFFVPGQPEMYGTFGVDEQGHIRDERGARITIQPGGFHDRLRTSTQPDFLGEAHTIQDDQAHVIAEGQRLSCGLWDGQKILGTLSSDNLLSARPLTNQDKEILRIYAAALGHLCTLKLAQAELHQLTNDLEQRVQDRTRQLEDANRELEAFSYSVSHDLRSPLRAIDGFSRLLMEDYADQLPPDARQYLERVRTAAQHMGQLIDDLLNLSRLSRAHVGRSRVNLSQVAQEIAADLTEGDPERPVDWQIAPDVIAHADANLIRIVLDNLLRNAWKFTAQQPQARIEFGCLQQDGRPVYVVRDNGAGFDMAYADKLFRPFQRLHSPGEFEGTGIGLTIVQRIIHRHGGRIWPEAAVGQGAAFYFTLG